MSDPLDALSGTRQRRRIVLTSADAIESEGIRWLWAGRVPLRGSTVFAGEKGLGKSLLTNARMVADATQGRLDGEFKDEPVDVIVVSAEDDWATVIKPRLSVAGADLARVHRLDIADDDGDRLFTLPDDVSILADKLAELRRDSRRVGLIVIDPISAFLSAAIHSHVDASVRRALYPLADLAITHDLAVVIVAHLNKDESRRLIARVSGAGAFVNAARSLLMVVRDPGDLEGEQGNDRLIVHVAANWASYAPTLSARTEAREVDLDDGTRTTTGYLVITGESAIGVDDLQRSEDISGNDCEEAIAEALKDGDKPSRVVKGTVTAELGCSRRTVERAATQMHARGELTIESSGFPRTTTWRLTVATATVATSPVSVGVATDVTDVTEPNPDPSRDSRDTTRTHDSTVPTEGETVDLMSRLRESISHAQNPETLFPTPNDRANREFAVPPDWEPYRATRNDDEDWRQH
jgi:hypothetical protein